MISVSVKTLILMSKIVKRNGVNTRGWALQFPCTTPGPLADKSSRLLPLVVPLQTVGAGVEMCLTPFAVLVIPHFSFIFSHSSFRTL